MPQIRYRSGIRQVPPVESPEPPKTAAATQGEVLPPLPPGYELVEEPFSKPGVQQPVERYPTISELPKNLGIGIGKGVLSTIKGGGEMLRRYVPGMRELDEATPDIPLGKTMNEMDLNPLNWQQSVGHTGEKISEYVIGGGGVPRILARAGLAGRGLIASIPAQSATAGFISGMHTEGDPESMAGTAILAGGLPIIVKGVGLVASAAGKRFQSSAIGQWYQAAKRYAQKVGAPPPPTPPPTATPTAGAAAVPRGTSTKGIGPKSTSTYHQPPSSASPKGQIKAQDDFIDVEWSPSPSPMPQGRIGAPTPPRQVGGMQNRLQLNPAEGRVLPPGTRGVPPGSVDPALPKHYADVPGQPAPPATMGKIRLGEEGGIAPRGEQTVTGTRLPLTRIPKGQEGAGRYRKLTPEETERFIAERGTAGRTSAPTPPPAPRSSKGKPKK